MANLGTLTATLNTPFDLDMSTYQTKDTDHTQAYDAIECPTDFVVLNRLTAEGGALRVYPFVEGTRTLTLTQNVVSDSFTVTVNYNHAAPENTPMVIAEPTAEDPYTYPVPLRLYAVGHYIQLPATGPFAPTAVPVSANTAIASVTTVSGRHRINFVANGLTTVAFDDYTFMVSCETITDWPRIYQLPATMQTTIPLAVIANLYSGEEVAYLTTGVVGTLSINEASVGVDNVLTSATGLYRATADVSRSYAQRLRVFERPQGTFSPANALLIQEIDFYLDVLGLRGEVPSRSQIRLGSGVGVTLPDGSIAPSLDDKIEALNLSVPPVDNNVETETIPLPDRVATTQWKFVLGETTIDRNGILVKLDNPNKLRKPDQGLKEGDFALPLRQDPRHYEFSWPHSDGEIDALMRDDDDDKIRFRIADRG